MDLDDLVAGWLTLPQVAEAIDQPLSKLRDMIRERRLVVVERGRPPVKYVPADFVVDGRLARGLSGALTVLRDAGFSDLEAVRWLLTDDPGLPGRPIDAMATGRDSAVKRRAQALAF